MSGPALVDMFAITTAARAGSTMHLARLHQRVIEVRARESELSDRLGSTRGELAALESEIGFLSRSDSPAAVWNASHSVGDAVARYGVLTKTRSGAWMDESGAGVVLVKGSLLPVPLTSLAEPS